jgi:hypothetical protein
MQTGLLLLALVASASAFAPMATTSRRSALNSVENELGAIPPLGYWDPLGLSSDGDMKKFTRRRAVEVKHGRIAMMAAGGWIWVDTIGKFDGYLSKTSNLKFADVPNGLAAVGKVPALGWIQVLALGAAMELVFWPAKNYSTDFGTGYFGFSLDADERASKLEKEISNGRLAMVGILGLAIGDSIVPGTPSPTADGIGYF